MRTERGSIRGCGATECGGKAQSNHNEAMSEPDWKSSLQPSRDKKLLRRQLQAERQSLFDRHARSVHLQEVLRVWLVARSDASVGAYWPIKGEFDALPALYRWSEADGARRIGLPVMDRQTKQLSFHVWYPGCPMEEDAYGIPKPKDTEVFAPTLLLVPCVGFGPKGLRLGYGGGFYDRTLAALSPRPFTVGLAYSHGYLPWLEAEAHDVPLDAILHEDGVAWDRSA
jgi:5-formyltetrahydrofolate cyclo-ligase